MKWILPVALFVSSLLLLGAARRARPPQPPVAVAYHDVLLKRDPVARGLVRIQSGAAGLAVQGSEARRALRERTLSPEPLIADEITTLEAGLRLNRNLYQRYLASSMNDGVDAAVRESRSDFEDFAQKRYRDMLTEFDQALAALETETLIAPLRDERRRLFNLRLKLDTLTRDRIVLSTVRLETLESQVQILNGILESKKRLGRRAFDIKENRMYDKLLGGNMSALAARNSELQRQVSELIDTLDRGVAVMLASYNTDLQHTRAQALERRNRLRRTMEEVQAPVAGPDPAPVAYSDAATQYQALFLDTLSARASAVALDHGAYLVLDSPLYYSDKVINITGDLSRLQTHGGSR